MIFSLNGKDYSANTLSGGYDINSTEKVFGSWEDGNGETHKVLTRKISGTIQMYFPQLADYDEFVTRVTATRADDHTNSVTLKVNNTGETKTMKAFVSFETVRSIDSAWNDTFGRFTVSIEEK